MNQSIKSCLLALVLVPPGLAYADIYQSRDAEGNVIYTDEPAPGAEEVELPETNVSDHVEPLPGEAPSSANTESTAPSQQHGSDVVVIPSRNEEVQRDYEADMPHQVLDAEEPYEVGDFPDEAELRRRQEARDGEYIDADGNTVRYEHQGHVGN